MVTNVTNNTNNQLTSPLYAGNGITCSVTFANPVTGVPVISWPPVDPTSVSFVYVGGTGASPITYEYGVGDEIVRASQGIYTIELDTTDAPGRWQVQWKGTGTCAAVWSSGFFVEPLPLN